ncbi:hypothetical protein AKJ39_03685 [candidate division MSBL1 archaeon SCGC-AAA259J03]|uniref:Thioredoxin domain-containing protein n=1 Tax=candidate division MSBL1 archaeon SCGC-AAA259J03 TaxID=1698269 RepID=A0A656YVI6_9EURY|nr:hypothetical protein AKJ39_03685 [candidate division MSBL1 archaeon SCGC-AAA259J03]
MRFFFSHFILFRYSNIIIYYFWADWCHPCKMMEPVMNSLAEELGDKAFFGKVNVDDEREAATEYQITSIPSVLFFKDGELADKLVGAVPEEDLKEKVEELTE